MAEQIEADAARWYAAQDGDAMDWDGFTAWLEADPRHRAAFDAIALLGDDLDRHRAAIAVQLPDAAPAAKPVRRWWLAAGGGGMAIAAGLALALLVPRGADETRYATGRGETRVIALADGTRVTLAPGSVLHVAGAAQDDLSVQGAAYFDVPHRPDRTLTVHAGAFAVRDIGTRFAVTSAAAAVRVEVAQGKVSVAASGLAAPVRLDAGASLVADLNAGGVRVTAVDPAAVASWRTGRLRYADAPLSLVAADIARYAGRRVEVDRALETRRFSGVLTIGDGSELAQSLAAILSIEVVEDGDTLRLRPRP